MRHLSYSETLSKYPSKGCHTIRQDIAALLKIHNIRLVILDDDPTGIQTVHDCLLLTNWKPAMLEEAFLSHIPFFYILTNTRSMGAAEAACVTREVMHAVLESNKQQGFKLIFISRSDSTLRGHFPLEPDTMMDVLQSGGFPTQLPIFFIPTFLEAGRFTLHQVQYIKDGDELIPVGETEFARDNVFAYQHSNLSDYIVEKTKGSIKAETIGCISLETIRSDRLDELEKAIKSNLNKTYVSVDALDYCDLQSFSMAFLTLFATLNSCAVLRTSSSLPKALSGLEDTELLNRKTLSVKPGTGLFVVGSHVNKSTTQLMQLLNHSNVQGVEIDINQILEQPDILLKNVLDSLKELSRQDITPVVYTSRQELRLSDTTRRLEIGHIISTFLVRLVRALPYTPSYIVAKGGITSHDILTKGLGIDKAFVMGQILPGVPVVRTDAQHTYPNMPYIIFPGNVGDEQALCTVLDKLG